VKTPRAVAILLLCALLAACGSTGSSDPATGTLAIGPTTWDVGAPAWYLHRVLHVGEKSVTLGDNVEGFVLGATGAYWLRGDRLMFTSAEGRTELAADGRWSNVAVSADRTVLAAVDQSRGPTDEFGTHVLQAAVFDTRTGALLYRTPDHSPDRGADLADLYEETTPLLHGVSDERLFFDHVTVDLADGSTHPLTLNSEGEDVYPGLADTLFPDGYHVGLRGEGTHRTPATSGVYGVGRLSPDRSTLFDTTMWPTPAVAYDARTGRQRTIAAPWSHFTLIGFSGQDRFFGIAQQIDEKHVDNILRAQQVVTCVLPALTCSAVSPVIPTEDPGISAYFQTEDVADVG